MNVCVRVSCARDRQCDMDLRILNAKFTCLFYCRRQISTGICPQDSAEIVQSTAKTIVKHLENGKITIGRKEFWLFSLQINRYPNTQLMQFFLFEVDKITRHRSLMEIQV